MREEFVTDYLWPTLRAGAVYEHKYLLGTSIARPLLAKRQVEVALKVGSDALAHGCTGKGNDQVRFELTYKALAPHLQMIAPWREWNIVSREDAIDYAAKHNVPVAQTKENLTAATATSGTSPTKAARSKIRPTRPTIHVAWMLPPEKASDKPAEVTIGFEKGTPVSVNGKKLAPVALLDELNAMGAATRRRPHRPGREPLRRHEVARRYETPGGTLLVTAHRELEALCSIAKRALQADALARLRRAGLQRPVVHAAARGAGRVLLDDAAARHRRGHAAAVQGQRQP